MTATSAKPAQPANNSLSPDDVGRGLSNLVDAVFNRLFALTHRAAVARNFMISVLFLGVIVVLVAGTRTIDQWSGLLGNVFYALLFPTLALPNGQAGSTAFTDLFIALIWNPEVLRRLVVLIAPYWLMHRITAIYLADIFEKDEHVARSFIRQAAFGVDYSTVRIREGKILESDQASPIVQIGGPGYVMVELDSAALFERPDGSPHIIPPTSREWRGRKVVEGFERIRQGADLREVMGSQEVSARSRDGIPVVAKDIQYSYSLNRGPSPVKTLLTPYPFIEEAILNLVYRTPRPIRPGIAPSGKPDWHAPLPGKIIGTIQLELGGFVSRHGLSEFLSNIGAPEEDALRSRAEELDSRGEHIPGLEEIFLQSKEFTARTSITDLFYNEEFIKRAADKGFQVNWIGVGTWATPTEIIPANHLEAWKISRENFLRSNPDILERLSEDAHLQEHLRLVQTMPIGKFYNDHERTPDTDLIEELLGEYYERLLSAKELYERDGVEVPFALEMGIRTLREVRNLPPYHSVEASG